jgi:hypothetical protein
MSMHVLTDRASALFSGQMAQSASLMIDARACQDYGLWFVSAGKAGAGTGASAILTLQGAPEGTSWLPIKTVTAVPGDSITAQIAGYYPYLRCSAGPCYTATGAAGSATAVLYSYYAPGIV